MKTIDMPSFGADMQSGKVAEWQAKPGDHLSKGDIVALIETSKGLIDMEVFEDCQIESYLVELDQEIDVGQPIIALVEIDNEQTIQKAKAAPKSTKTKKVASKTLSDANSEPKSPSVQPQDGHDPLMTPAAKAYAAEHNFNMAAITGTAAGGAIGLNDLQKHELSVTQHKAPSSGFDSGQMRQAIAAVVSKSKREIPHYYMSLDIDLTASEQWLAALNAERTPDDRLMINVPIMCSIARALKRHPDFNGTYEHDLFTPADAVHLGVAIRLRNKGLITPAILNADQLNAAEMMERFKSIVERSKSGGLKFSELQAATVTLSNIGDRGSDQIFGVIFPPQVLILGVGKVSARAIVVNGKVEARTTVNISLAADHRVTDGHLGARLLNDISKQLQNPETFNGDAS